MPTTTLQSRDEVLLLAYSTGDGASGLKLATSGDGYTFRALNAGKGLWTGTVGDARVVRDPCIHLGPDGTLHCVWTTGPSEPRIGYSRTRDLRSWTPQRLIGPSAGSPGVGWRTPRLLVDPVLGHFVLCATTGNGHVFGTITTDFAHFEPVKSLLDRSAVRDANIARDETRDRWVMFATDDRSAARPNGGVFVAASDRLDGPYETVRPAFTGATPAAAPSAIRVGDRWFCYVDRLSERTASLMTSRDLDNWQEETDALSLPIGARAFTVIGVPRSLVEHFEA